MALKERKQLTGTDAQIKAYAGHNGQLVYATDTKHLHVLSGTAGTSVELANTSDLTKVNQTINQGLAGKEDKGTCLPLSGGTLTGDFVKVGTASNKIVFNESSTGRGLYILTDPQKDLENPLLLLRAKEAVSSDAGQFALNAVNKDTGEIHTLRGMPSIGALAWNNRTIDTISSGTMHACIQYQETGLQICWGATIIPPTGTVLVNFPKPFRDTGYVMVTQIAGESISNKINYEVLCQPHTGANAYLHSIVGSGVGQLGVFWMAIGYWRH